MMRDLLRRLVIGAVICAGVYWPLSLVLSLLASRPALRAADQGDAVGEYPHREFGAQVWREMARRYQARPGQAFVLTENAVIPCFSWGTDGNEPLGCEAAVAESYFVQQCRGLEQFWRGNPNDPCSVLEKKWLELKKRAEYCGICGPTGPELRKKGK